MARDPRRAGVGGLGVGGGGKPFLLPCCEPSVLSPVLCSIGTRDVNWGAWIWGSVGWGSLVLCWESERWHPKGLARVGIPREPRPDGRRAGVPSGFTAGPPLTALEHTRRSVAVTDQQVDFQ